MDKLALKNNLPTGHVIFKFIHAADIHLGSPLKGLEQYAGAPVEEIRRAPREGLKNLVDLAVDHDVKFVLIAGDLYDGDWPNFQTGLYFVSQAARLNAAKIPLFLIAGNHDAANKMTRSLPLPENVTFFSPAEPHTAMIDELDVAIHGQSFAKAAVHEDLSKNYPTAIANCFNIGLLHTSADGREGHDSYAPCSIEGLKLKGYDYWALGHIHKREILCEQPFISFSGNIQGRHIRETGPKGCWLVTVNDNRSLTTQFEPLDVLRWAVGTVDLASASETDEVMDLVRQELERLRSHSGDLPLAVRVELRGTTTIHRELHASKEHWTNQIRSLAIDAGQGKLWIEKVKFYTTAITGDKSPTSLDDGAVSELVELFKQIRKNPAQLAEIGFDFAPVVSKLPAELKSLVGLGESNENWLQSVIDDAESLLLHRLLHNSDSSDS